MIDIRCPYCGHYVGNVDSLSHAHTWWCGQCPPNPATPHWKAYSRLLSKLNLPIGVTFYSLWCDPEQLQDHLMTDSALELMTKLYDATYPRTDDLLKLHELLQHPDNSEQVICSPDDIDKLAEILRRTVDVTPAITGLIPDVWAQADNVDEDL